VIWDNQYFVAGVISWMVAFVANYLINSNHQKVKTAEELWLVSGGMPSKHAATVIGVACTALLVDGVDSAAFAIAGTLAAVTMYDAINVRRAVGQNRAAILALYDHVKEAKPLHEDDPLREFKSLGHKPLEVLIGAVIGALVAALVHYLVF